MSTMLGHLTSDSARGTGGEARDLRGSLVLLQQAVPNTARALCSSHGRQFPIMLDEGYLPLPLGPGSWLVRVQFYIL